ncbi:MAG TPA: hypothetical protein VMS56_14840 [Thermoanaerobaculia bacterium]|nr:hypothetical protein [Thermoanaerobaculia bacterium]
MTIERELREALRRPEAPPGFASRVVARARAGERGEGGRGRGNAARALAAGVLLALTLGVVGGYRWERRRTAERAAESAVTALRIASEKLNLARQNIHNHAAE